VLIGYVRVSTQVQNLELQLDALRAAGVDAEHIYEEKASGKKDDRPVLAACLKSLRKGDTLVIWKLDRLGRNLKHLIEEVEMLSKRGIGFKVLAGAPIETTSPQGKLAFAIFSALAEFERDVIRERTLAGLEAARARGRKGGRKHSLSPAKLRTAQAAMANRDTSVADLAKELGVSKVTLYRHVTPKGELTEKGKAILKKKAA
jgi:DNA invertase Pin-like site-specific DNA recombinase